MAAFVAAIRRVPGVGFVKAARSPNAAAIPGETTLRNLLTYFTPWPQSNGSYLLYGPRVLMTTAPIAARDPKRQRLGAVRAFSSGTGGGHGGGQEHLYGPNLHVVPPAGDDGGPPTSKAAIAAAAAAAVAAAAKPLGLAGIMRRFKRGEKLAMVTSYDFPSSRLARGAGVDLVLVGDSLGNCRLGLPDTVGVTMEDMLSATRSVRRGLDTPPVMGLSKPSPKPVLVGDMPFGSYLVEADALRNAANLRMAGAELVKLEGGRTLAPMVRSMTLAGIPIMAHIGLMPQSAALQGGLRLQGTTAQSARELVEDAKALADAGAVSIVIECVPEEVGAAVQAAVPHVPIIGIGAGGGVAGQVLVCDDLWGLHGKPPSFVKMYADIGKSSAAAFENYVQEVRSGAFPGKAYARSMKEAELEKFSSLMPEVWNTAKTMLPKPQDVEELSVLIKQETKTSELGPLPIALGQSTTSTSGNIGNPLPASVFLDFASGRFANLPAKASLSLSQARMLSSIPRSLSEDTKVLRTVKDVRGWRKSMSEMGRSVALVPTMGNLHEGHLELIDEAKKHVDEVLVSIFVNPSQFAAHEDLDTYPRTLESDLRKLEERGVHVVFAPQADEMYPSGSPGGTVVVPRFVQGKSEDACRPHFFTGVATVCLKLFNLSKPDVVIFGQKDAMQCCVIGRMLEDLLLDVKMVVAPTSREQDGLARSSRNSYLTAGMRKQAPAIYKALSTRTADLTASSKEVRDAVTADLEAVGFEVSYVSVADPREMTEKNDSDKIANSIVSIACIVRDGETQCRLIDNVVVPTNESA